MQDTAHHCGLSYAFSVRKANPSVCIVGYDFVGGGDGCIVSLMSLVEALANWY